MSGFKNLIILSCAMVLTYLVVKKIRLRRREGKSTIMACPYQQTLVNDNMQLIPINTNTIMYDSDSDADSDIELENQYETVHEYDNEPNYITEHRNESLYNGYDKHFSNDFAYYDEYE